MAVCDGIGGSYSVSPTCRKGQIGRTCAVASAVVEGGQALGLVLQLAAGRLGQGLERLQPHLAPLVAPGPGHRPVDQEGRERVGALVWKMRPRCRSGRSWVRWAW